MDLQAILDESSSDDEEATNSSIGIGGRNSNNHRQNTHTSGYLHREMADLILNSPSSNGFMKDDVSDNDDWTATPTFEQHLTRVGTNNSTCAKHNAEDWAVLQAILNEEESDDDKDEDDDEDEDDVDLRVGMSTSYDEDEDTMLYLNTSTSRNMTVNSILQSMGYDDDDDVEDEEDDHSLGLISMTSDLQTRGRVANSSIGMAQKRRGDYAGDILQSLSENDGGGSDYIDHRDASFFAEYKGLVMSQTNSPSPLKNNSTSAACPILDDDEDGSYVITNKSDFSPTFDPKDSSSLQMDKPLSLSKYYGEEDVHNIDMQFTSKAISQKMKGQSILERAEAYEQTLLKSGCRDLISPLMVKRKMKPKIELRTRSRKSSTSLQSDSNGTSSISNFSTNSGSTKYNISGIVETKSIPNISEELKYLKRKQVVGLPTAVALNSKFIAIGTQKGVIQVFDLFGSVRQRLVKATTEEFGSVTTIDLSYSGDTIIAGYTSGVVIWWDVITGKSMKSISDMHHSPITVVRFINEASIISVDASGLVYKFNFTKSVVWTSYGVDSECLLDGTAGQILSMHVLPSLETLKLTPDEITTHVCRNLTLIALSSERSSFAVAVEPSINVLHRWARPTDTEKANSGKSHVSNYLPCLAWGWGLIPGGGATCNPILARAWDLSIQFLRANFPEDDNPEIDVLWPAFGVHDEFEVLAPVVALEWLGERTMVYLTTANEFTVVDTVVMNLIERLDFTSMQLIYAEFSLTSRNDDKGQKNSNSQGNALSKTFLNSFRSYDQRLLVLCQEEVKSIGILGVKRRIAALENDGEWLQALALALDHYENAIKSLEDRKRAEPGDFSLHPEFLMSKSKISDESWLAGLLMRYVNLAIENAPDAYQSEEYSSFTTSSILDLSHSHFQMLAGVCVDFCIVTKRLDLLYGKIFRKFQEAAQVSIFFDVLEPYILSDKLRYISPAVMPHFIEHHVVAKDVTAVERSLLHMDVTIMDFHLILNILRKKEMFSALVYVYTQGLDDFLSPLQILMDATFDAAVECDIFRKCNSEPTLNKFERYGSKTILFLQYSLRNKSFPQGRTLPDGRLLSIRSQLMHFLLRENYSPLSETNGHIQATGYRSQSFPYLRILILLDSKSVLETLSLALDSADAQFAGSSYMSSFDGLDVEVDVDQFEPSDAAKNIQVVSPSKVKAFKDAERSKDDSVLCPDRQLLIGVLSSIFLSDKDIDSESLGDFFDFVAKYLVKGVIRVPKSLTTRVLSRVAHAPTNILSARRSAQEKVLSLLEALPSNSYDRNDFLSIVEDASMNRAALFLHRTRDFGGVSSPSSPSNHILHFIRAIECYLEDYDEEFRRGVFTFIENESTYLRGGKGDALRNALRAKLPHLIQLDVIKSALMIADLYMDQLEEAIDSLSSEEPMQYNFFQAVFSGELAKVDTLSSNTIKERFTPQHQKAYLVLMVKFDPCMIYHFLTSSDDYDIEFCLKLCQDNEIADASAYLLERSGNIPGALQLILQTLEERMMSFKKVVRNSVRVDSATLGYKGRRKLTSDIEKQNEIEIRGIKQMLFAALELCERNSSTEQSENGPQLWFSILDRLICAKGFLRLSRELPHHSHIISYVLNDLLQLTMQRMVSNISLPDLVRKITTDHRSSRLGEFREMITSMLRTYSRELVVCSNAIDAMHSDLRCLSLKKKNLKSRGSLASYMAGKSIVASKLSSSRFPAKARMNVEANGNVIILADSSMNNTIDDSESDEITTLVLRQLQKKRARHLSRKRTSQGRTKSTLNMMTILDIKFEEGEISEAVMNGGPRQIGLLSGPLNVGCFY